jgi:hypothetical protein
MTKRIHVGVPTEVRDKDVQVQLDIWHKNLLFYLDLLSQSYD